MRAVILMVFASIFVPEGANNSIADFDVVEEAKTINIYLVLIPYVTAIPLCSILAWLIKTPKSKVKFGDPNNKNIKKGYGREK